MASPIILVFGTDTPLGKRLVFYLEGYAKDRNQEVLIVGEESMPLSIERIQKAVWTHYVGDYHQGRPTFIINAFEMNDIKSCQYSPERAFTMNSITATHIVLAARSANIPMIQISSDQVLGEGGPHTSQDNPRPLNTYGISKLYAERAMEAIYPIEERDPAKPPFGATIIRISEQFGFDVDSYAKMALETSALNRSILVPDRTRLSYSFIGETAFVIARNVVDSPQLLTLPIIHVAAKDEPLTWRELLLQNGIEDVKEGVISRTVTLPRSGGLAPTPGWFLSSGHKKQWEDFVREHEAGRYLVYW